MTISSKSRVFRLELPSLEVDAGRIAVGPLGGTPLLDSRPFPSGILPHDPDGIRLLEQWDADYRGKKPPPWDIGKPAKELKELVDEKRVLPSRVIDLCCGTGTDAIFLARRGFDVTAVDISPTALAQAQQKAQQAGVPVRWVLADVLAAPRLEPFDFIYDRGCYHVVRDQNLPAYLEAVRRLSRPGSQFLLLAARRELASRDDGPAGVTEEELRFDFLSLFDIEWLRETRLEANRPGGMGPPSWAALLTRRADVNPVR
jgi:SAM-dependent methyltransferase